MAELINDRKVFSLSEVAKSIQKTLTERYGSSFWIKAEMIKLHHYPHSGHCYPEFVEKANGRVVTQLKGTLWREDYWRINARFEEILKEPLKDGINILFCARITFEPLHGLSLRILDIDPSFSLGELERVKLETIQKLREEGLYYANKQRSMALLPQRIAIISVETSKGYADFIKVIGENAWGYRFFHMLFPSLLQGDSAVDSIRNQLRRIRKSISHFDVVAIIRGGGGDIGLSCFNDLALSREIARFPIPVITGIGHATNETVVEMVAHKNAITPTELADYLLQKFHDFSNPVQRAGQLLQDRIPRIVTDNRARFQDSVKYFRSLTANMLNRNSGQLSASSRSLLHHARFLISRERGEHLSLVKSLRRGVALRCLDAQAVIGHLARTVDAMHPANVLKRGYSITRYNGKALRNADDARAGDIIQTTLFEGTIESEVKSIQNPRGT